jgi:hypothetical protein
MATNPPDPTKNMKRILIILVSALLSGCVTSSKKLSQVENGMTKAEVVKLLGDPKSVSLRDGSEFLRYQLSGRYAPVLNPNGRQFADDYTVQLVNGSVVAYGRDDEFQPVRIQVAPGPIR